MLISQDDVREVTLKRWMFGAAFGLFALSGTPVQAQEPAEPARASAPGFDFWGTGEGSYFYHRLSGDCDTVHHRHGRNAAWGSWEMPLARIGEGGPEETERGGIVLRFRCLDGSACIESGRGSFVTGHDVEHAIPFQNMERAHAFSQRVAQLRVACGIGR